MEGICQVNSNNNNFGEKTTITSATISRQKSGTGRGDQNQIERERQDNGRIEGFDCNAAKLALLDLRCYLNC